MGESYMESSKILIVDDDVFNRELLEVILAGDGHRTFSIENGIKALQIAREQEVDLVLLDIMMPGMAGFEVCNKLKEDEATRDIPIIFISARDDRDSISKGFELGAYDYFTKPVNQAEIQVKINNCLKLNLTEKKLKKEHAIRRKTEHAIQIISEETAGEIGESFFESLVMNLGQILDVDCAFIGEWDQQEGVWIGISALYVKEGVGKGYKPNLSIAPYKQVKRQKMIVYAKGVRAAFPEDSFLVDMKAESFVAAPLSDKEGASLGMLVICDSKPIVDPAHFEAIIRAFSVRASSELARVKVEKQMQFQKQRLDLAIDTSAAGIYDHTFPFGEGNYVNDRFAEILGYAKVDMPSWGKLLDWFFARIHPEDTLPLREEYIDLIRGKLDALDREFRVRHKNGEWIWIEMNTQAIERNEDELATRIIGVILDVSERHEIQRRILNTIIETEEKERSRFAQDLHDGLGPLLSTAKLYIKSLDSLTDKEKRDFASRKSIEIMDEAISSIRDIANNISPHILKNFGLNSAIRSFLKHLPEAEELEIDLHTDIPERPSENVELTLFRIIVELIHNTVKHASASKVGIRIKCVDQRIIVEYNDNGIGFDVDSILHNPSGMGMSNIVNRVRSFEGDISFERNLLIGFGVRIEIGLKG